MAELPRPHDTLSHGTQFLHVSYAAAAVFLNDYRHGLDRCDRDIKGKE
jgi:hypothetical protein